MLIVPKTNNQTMTIGNGESKKTLPLTVDQFYEKKEILREKIISEAKRLGLSLDMITGVFSGKENLNGSEFKRKMRDLGFSLVDFRDEDIMVLDENEDGTISCKEFLNFVKKGFLHDDSTLLLKPPLQPVDDLLYKATDLEGVVTVSISSARGLREPVTWFHSPEAKDVDMGSSKNITRAVIRYDVKAASIAHSKIAEYADTAVQYAQDLTDDDILNMMSSNERSSIASSKLTPLQSPTSPDSSLFSPLNSSMGKKSAVDWGNDQNSVVTIQSDSVKNAGIEAGNRLHTDKALMSGEASRTKGLNRLKLKQQNGGLSSIYSDRGAEMEKESVLRKKISVVKSHEKRNLENDLEAQIFLNYIPPKKVNLRKTSVMSKKLFPNKNRDLSIFDPTIQNPNALYTSTKVTLKSDNNISNNRADNTVSKIPDLWEVLVDRVITVTESRSKNNEKIAMIPITRNFTTDFFDSISPSRSPIPSPAVRGTGQSSVRKPGMGTVATPKNLKSKAGSASVKVAQTISRQRNNVIDVKEKLKQIKKEKKKISSKYIDDYYMCQLVHTLK